MTAEEEILARAAELVEEQWGQGDSSQIFPSGGHCANSAMVFASERGSATESTERAALSALKNELGVFWTEGIWRWNDAPGRTKEEVAAALRNAKRFLAPEDCAR